MEPSVNQEVGYWPPGKAFLGDPLRAVILSVEYATCVNLQVQPPDGEPYEQPNVHYVASGVPHVSDGNYCFELSAAAPAFAGTPLTDVPPLAAAESDPPLPSSDSLSEPAAEVAATES